MKKSKTCKGCGAKEKITKIAGTKWTNFALGGYCAKCVNRAMEEISSVKA